MKNTSPDAIVAGHICLDVIPDLSGSSLQEFERQFAPGRLLEVGPAQFSTGGAVANTGLALHKLGISTSLMGKIGDDLFGRAVLQLVAEQGAGLAEGMVVDEDDRTSYTIVISPPQRDRIFLHDPAANASFSADDVDYDLLAGARLFHFGYPPLMQRMFAEEGAQLTAMFRQAKAAGVTTSLDLALPDPTSAAGKADWRAILTKTLPYVDVFLPSVEEILYMLRRDFYEELLRSTRGGDILPLLSPELLSDLGRELVEMGVALAGVKLGERGMYLRSTHRSRIEAMGRARPSAPGAWAEMELWAPPFRVAVAGATGAGDGAIAGFLAALLRDMALEEALTMAVAVGACNVEAADSLSGILPWEQVRARVQAGWPRRELSLADPGWRFLERWQLWQREA